MNRSQLLISLPARSDSGPGFSLIEVAIALLIIGVLLTSIFGLQNTLFSRTQRQHHQLAAQQALINLLQDEQFVVELQKQNSFERTLAEPALAVSVSSQSLGSGEGPADWPGVKLVTLTGRWSESYLGSKTVTVTTLIYAPSEIAKADKSKADKTKTGAVQQVLTAKAGGNDQANPAPGGAVKSGADKAGPDKSAPVSKGG